MVTGSNIVHYQRQFGIQTKSVNISIDVEMFRTRWEDARHRNSDPKD